MMGIVIMSFLATGDDSYIEDGKVSLPSFSVALFYKEA